MSGAFPTSPVLSHLEIKSITATLESVSHNLARQVRTRGGQRWYIEGDFSTVDRADWAGLFAFAMKQRGKFESFTFTHPAISLPYGDTLGSEPTVDNGQDPARSVDLSDWVAGARLNAGSFFKFAGHAKVYMVTEDFIADGGGEGTLTFEPAVSEVLASGESVIITNVPFTMAFVDDVLETVVKTNWAYELKIKIVETP